MLRVSASTRVFPSSSRDGMKRVLGRCGFFTTLTFSHILSMLCPHSFAISLSLCGKTLETLTELGYGIKGKTNPLIFGKDILQLIED